jgi:hypothetical protein
MILSDRTAFSFQYLGPTANDLGLDHLPARDLGGCDTRIGSTTERKCTPSGGFLTEYPGSQEDS